MQLQKLAKIGKEIISERDHTKFDALLQDCINPCNFSINEDNLINVLGFTTTNAKRIVKLFEFAKEFKYLCPPTMTQIKKSDMIYRHLYADMAHKNHEVCYLICLNRANKITNTIKISEGGRAGTVVDAKIIFQIALEKGASCIILAHNHPSGSLQPSQADRSLTEKLVSAGKFMDMPLLDHLIITANGYYSFADHDEM